MKAYVFYDELGKDIREEEIPEDHGRDLHEEYHEKLLEAVADEDDAHHGAVSRAARKSPERR